VSQTGQLEQVVGALDQLLPVSDLLAQALGCAQDMLSTALIGPEVGRARLGVELVETLLFGV
jgi:hypothetical protein